MAIDKFGKGGFDSADKSFQGLGNLSGSSQFTVVGCTDSTMFNFNPGANTPCCNICDGTDDNEAISGNCCIPVIFGCLDPSADNFNNTDVNFPNSGTPLGCDFSNPPVCLPAGCDIFHGTNTLPSAYPAGYAPGGPPCSNVLTDANTSPDPSDPVWGAHTCQYQGCTDPSAINYDPQANVDNGTCTPTITGCMDSSMDPNQFQYWNGQVISQTIPNVLWKINHGQMGVFPDRLDYHLYINSYAAFNDPFNLPPANVLPPNTPCGPSATVGCLPTTADPTACGDYTTAGNNECCQPRIYGCMQPTGTLNYDPTANTETPDYCEMAIPGCMDSSACNYESSAQFDDGSCTVCDGSVAFFANNYTYGTTHCGNDNKCTFCHPVENVDTGLVTPNSIQVTWTAPSSIVPPLTAPISDYTLRYRVNPGGQYIEIPNIPVGTTSYTITGLSTSTQYKIQIRSNCSNTNSNTGPGNWNQAQKLKSTPQQMGCMDPAANNYFGIAATADDGSCTYTGCTDPLAINQSSFVHPIDGLTYYATVDDGSCIPAVPGCIDDGSCNGTNCGAAGFISNIPANCTPGVDCLSATNYNVLANVNDGSCLYPPIGCLDGAATNTAPPIIFNDPNSIHDNSCIYQGCTDPGAANYGFLDSITPSVASWPGIVNLMDYSGSYGYIYLDGGTGTALPPQDHYVTAGAMHPLAGTPLTLTGTVVDDGSCTYNIIGCTDSNANNYSPSATVSCERDDGTGTMIPNGCCCFGSSAWSYNFEGHFTDDGTLTGNAGDDCLAGCTDTGFGNSYLSSNYYSNVTTVPTSSSANTPVYVDKHPSLLQHSGSDGEGCMNFTQQPVITTTIHANGTSGYNSNVLTSGISIPHPQFGTILPLGTMSQHGIEFSISCDDSSGGCPDMSYYPNLGSGEVLATRMNIHIDNRTTGTRFAGIYDMRMHDSGNSNLNLNSSSQIDFWGNTHLSDNSPVQNDRNVAKPLGTRNLEAGLINAIANNTVLDSGKPFGIKPRFLWELIDGTDRDAHITAAVNGNLSSYLSSGNKGASSQLEIVITNGWGAITHHETFMVVPGCLDVLATNYCPTCNATPKFSQFSPPTTGNWNSPGYSSTNYMTDATNSTNGNYTICTYN